MITFTLSAQQALWRNPREAGSRLTMPGPAPSHVAGLLGCVMGFANDHRAVEPPKKAKVAPPLWPISPDLLAWEEEKDCRVAVAWNGPLHIPRHTHAVKLAKDFFASEEGFSPHEQVFVWEPSYLVAVQLKGDEQALAAALREPQWRPYLGNRSCPAWIEDVQVGPRPGRWAIVNPDALEPTHISRHVVNDRETGERIEMDGTIWDFMPGGQAALPEDRHFLRTWARL